MAVKPESIPLNYKSCTQLKLAGVIAHFFPLGTLTSWLVTEWRCALLWAFLICSGEVLDLVWPNDLLLYRRIVYLFWRWWSLRLLLHMWNRKSCLTSQPSLAGFYMVTPPSHAWLSFYWEHESIAVSWFNPRQQLSTMQPLTHAPLPAHLTLGRIWKRIERMLNPRVEIRAV